jgi:hypothetical protein
MASRRRGRWGRFDGYGRLIGPGRIGGTLGRRRWMLAR